MGYNSTISQVIHNGFDLSKFRPSINSRDSVRAELGVDKYDFLIGSFARFHPMKDHANFFEAARLISKKFNHAKFLLIGKQITIHNQYIMELINKNNLASQVILLGERNDIPRLMVALDVLTVSSAWGESFPMVIGEAMACGIPCVVTDIGDSAMIVGQTGIVIHSKNSQALSNAWEELIALSPEKRFKLGIEARHRIEENYSIERMVSAYITLYEEIVNSRK